MTFEIAKTNLTFEDAELFLASAAKCRDYLGIHQVLMQRPDLTSGQALAFMNRMAGEGILSYDEGQFFEITDLGKSLQASGLAPRVSPQEAQAALAKVLSKVREWNRKTDQPSIITEVKLFGSFLHDKPSYGDVDIELAFGERPLTAQQTAACIEALPKTSKGSLFYTINPERFMISQANRVAFTAVSRASKIATLTGAGTIEEIGAAWKHVYLFDAKKGQEVIPSDKIHPRTKPWKAIAGSAGVMCPNLVHPNVQPSDPARLRDVFSSGTVADIIADAFFGKVDERGVTNPISPADERETAEIMGALWIDNCPAWDIKSTNPFAAISQIHRRGVAEGIFSNGVLNFMISKSEAVCEFSAPVDPDGKERDVAFRIEWTSAERTADLLPMGLTWTEDGDEMTSRNRRLSDAGHIGAARAMTMPLFEIVESLKMGGSVTAFDMYFSWDPTSGTPTLPTVGRLMRHVTKTALKDELPADVVKHLLEISITGEDPGGHFYVRSAHLHRTIDVSVYVTDGHPQVERLENGICVSSKLTRHRRTAIEGDLNTDRISQDILDIMTAVPATIDYSLLVKRTADFHAKSDSLDPADFIDAMIKAGMVFDRRELEAETALSPDF